MRPGDKLVISVTFLCVLIYYFKKILANFKIGRYKKQAKKNELSIIKSLEEQGYELFDICSPKKVEYYKDNNTYIDSLPSRLVVKKQGKKFIVESYSQSQTISLRDSLIKLKIFTNIACYNINGVLFINSKGQAIKECTIRVVKGNIILSVIKKCFLLIFFTILGFYLSQIFL